jgi:GNAT superfamily N-acetyltransferase
VERADREAPSAIVTIRLIHLADRPDLIPTLARWHFDQWRDLVPGWSVEAAGQDLAAHTGRGVIPETVVALDHGGILGSVSLVADDLPDLPPYTPWLASLFVRPEARGRGVGRTLVERVVADAAAGGATRLHLLTTDAERYYQGQDFRTLERLAYRGFDAKIMGRDLRPTIS